MCGGTVTSRRQLCVCEPCVNPPSTPLAPHCGNGQEQSQSPWHSPSVVFVFQTGFGGEWVDGWAGVGLGEE